MAEKRMGDKNPFYGRKHTEETRKIITEKNIGREGYWIGKKFSDDHLAKMKINRTCPHCDKSGSGSAMNRYHMDNCKFKAEAA
jgi:CRISPR/Cas system-associated protein Cas10 (large subunit of type III CRISPR-Cas system)